MTQGERRELTAIVTAGPGRADALRACLVDLAAKSANEPGCLELRVFEQNDVPGTFVLWEIFADDAAIAVHEDTAYVKAYFASDLVASRQVIWHRRIR